MPQNTTRNFALPDAAVATLKAEFEATGKFPNPYRGNYGAIVAALTELGLNEVHPFAEIQAAAKKQMGTKWDAFASKETRNQNGKDADGRLLANVQVLQRRKDYGLKLVQTRGRHCQGQAARWVARLRAVLRRQRGRPSGEGGDRQGYEGDLQVQGVAEANRGEAEGDQKSFQEDEQV